MELFKKYDTLEKLRKATDADIGQMVQAIRGRSTKDFKDIFAVKYTYTSFANELRSRGWISGWHKVSEGDQVSLEANNDMDNLEIVIPVGEKSKKSYFLTSEFATIWDEFLNTFSAHKGSIAEVAFKRFYNEAQNKKIVIVINNIT